MEEHRRVEYKQRVRTYVKLYTFVLLAAVIVMGVLFRQELVTKFGKNGDQYIDISFSVYGGLVGSMLNILVYLPMTFRHLRSWSEEDREANFCWLFLRPLLGGLSGFVSYGFVNAMPIELDVGDAQRLFWLMFCIAVFAGFKSEDFVLRFSQRFENLLPQSDKSGKPDPNSPERVIPLKRRSRGYRNF